MAEVGALAQAKEALGLVQVNPAEASRRAAAVALRARRCGVWDAASVAERALGLSAVHLHDLPVATRHLRKAIELAQRDDSAELAAQARMTLAFALGRSGQPEQAVRQIDHALADLGDQARSHGLVQRAAILQQLGRLDEALADYRVALADLRRTQDLVWVQRILLNRGVLHVFRHGFGAAERDLHEAEQLCADLGLTLPAAFVQENLVLLHRRRGDVPAALHHLDRAEKLYRSLGAPYGSLLLEGSELMLQVGLYGEAREAAEKAVADFARTGRHLNAPEARLLLARTAVLDGDPAGAVRQARRAVRELTKQGRPEWVVLAECSLLLAQAEDPSGPRPRLRRIADVADRAEAAGWTATAVDVRLLAARHGCAGTTAEGRRPVLRYSTLAHRQLELAGAHRRTGPAATRAKAWYAAALLRQGDGDTRKASAAADRGLQILEDYRATMAATDLRARVSGLGVDLVRLGLRNALTRGSPPEVLAWAERGRARRLLQPAALPPSDPEFVRLLAELRGVVADIGERRRAGESLGGLRSRQVELEREVRDACRRRPGGNGQVVPSVRGTRAFVAQLGDALGSAVLVEFLSVDDTLYAVCVKDGRSTLRCVGSTTRLRELVRWLPFALVRLARQRDDPRSTAAAVDLLRRVARDLDEVLLHPLRDEVSGRPIVLVPTGLLQSLPWSLLPSLAGAPVTVAPSASLWAAAYRRPQRPGPVMVVAGPDLPGAHEEAVEVAALHGVEPLVGSSATVESVTDGVSGASLLHLAAHGTVRADNPLFSCLQLFDGPLTVYDLERLEGDPGTVVLAACESGRDVVLAGDEMLGLSAAFLARRTRQVVASVVPVPDAATRPLMVALHRLLARGVPVADALAGAQQGIDKDHPAAFAAAAGFVCIGAGLAGPSH